ncbi:MAG TPA: hypothetical protein PK915_10265 [Bacteroidales bacterium]|nr:hypothetical protein [Bacteroidales bacterium]
MSGKFSFLANDFAQFLKYAHLLIPGARRIDAIFRNSEDDEFEALTVDLLEADPEVKEMNISGNINELDRLRKVKAQSSWYSEDELPFSQVQSSYRIPDVFSEIEKVVLALRIPDQIGGKNDMIFVYFRSNMSTFGINSSQAKLTPEAKNIIARMVSNSFYALRKIASDDRSIWFSVVDMMRENRQKTEMLNRKIEYLQERYEERLVDSCKYFLSGISATEGRRFVFTDDAINLIKSSSLEYHRIENAIQVAVQLAKNFEFDRKQGIVEITADYLNFNAPLSEKEGESLADTVLEKPFNYLNMLEEAAVKVQSAKKPVTAKNLVNEFERPVNPSAITWMVNNNMKTFKKLFALYPDHWQIIRTQFRPILRILNPDDDKQKSSQRQ